MKQVIVTQNAPSAIGTYSQAVKAGNLVFLSGQIPLVPETMQLVEGDFAEHVRQVFRNIQAVAQAAGGGFAHIVKLSVFLTDMANFPIVNEVMAEFCDEPYPARAVVGVSELPKGVAVEMEAIMLMSE